MSGRRQHYLPRFLQRPFRSRIKGGDFVHVHEQGRAPYLANLMGVGQERDFYGHPDHSALDDAITRHEDRLVQILRHLEADGLTRVTNQQVASLLSAIALRTKKMREALVGLIPLLTSWARQQHGDALEVARAVEEQLANIRERDRIIEEQLEKLPRLNREARHKARTIARQHWQRTIEAKRDEWRSQAQSMLLELLDKIDEEADSIATKAFHQALTRLLADPDRNDHFEAYTYMLWDVAPPDYLVLGDCGVIGQRADGQWRLALGNMSDEVPLDLVVLPISPQRCIIGRRSGSIDPPSVVEINEASAALSHRFFISDREDDQQAVLRDRVGSLEPIGSRDELSQLLAQTG